MSMTTTDLTFTYKFQVKEDYGSYGSKTVIGQVGLGDIVLYEEEQYLWNEDEVAKFSEDRFRTGIIDGFGEALASLIRMGKALHS